MKQTKCGIAPTSCDPCRPEAKKPYMYKMYNGTVKWPRGSIVHVGELSFVNVDVESRKPNCGPSNWRFFDLANVNLKLQRLGECGADFIFPPIERPKLSAVCDEPENPQAWPQGRVGTFDGALYTPAAGKGTVHSTPDSEPSDWCGPYKPEQVIAHVMHLMCES